MSLRIYIKGTPKFSSPKRTTQALPFSPNFNSLYASKQSNQAKGKTSHALDSKDPSVMHETNTLSMDNPSPSFDEHSTSSQLIKRKGTGQFTGRLLNNKTEDQQTDRFSKNERELRSQKEIQDAIKDFNVKLNNRANVPEKQLRKIIKESDNMILSLLEEVEQLTEMLTDKLKDNDMLKSFTTIPTSTQDYRFRPGTADDARTDIEQFPRNDKWSLLENGEISRLMQENKKLTDDITKLTEHNSELTEEVALLREMGSSSDKSLQKERESFMRLKSQAEELLLANDELTARSKDKDREIQRLTEELLDAKVCAEKLRREAGKSLLEDPRKNLLAGLLSPQDNLGTIKVRDEMNHTLSPFSKGVSPTMWSQFKVESPSLYFQMDKSKEEMKELQKRYEDTKNDNGKLMKIIEENQKVIKDLRDAFAELEKRSSVRFEEIKVFYESTRGDGALQEANFNIPKPGNRTENNESMTKATSRNLNSFASSTSRGIHSKKPSSESAPRSKRSLIPTVI